MKKFLITVFLLHLPAITYSKWDWAAQSAARSYPIGAYVAGMLGKSFLLWGDPKPGNPFYGYIRPNLDFRTSAFLNEGRFQVDFAPVSFFHFYAGTGRANQNTPNLQAFDCDVIHCKGLIDRSWAGVKFALRFKNWFLLSDNRWERQRVRNLDAIFADPRPALTIESTGDTFAQHILMMGSDFNKNWAGGVLLIGNSVRKTHENSRMDMLFSRFKNGPWSISLAAGRFRTRFDGDVGSMLMLIDYVPQMGLRLF